MNLHSNSTRPPIHMIDTEADALALLAERGQTRTTEVTDMLLGEIERATVHPAHDLPPDVVSMNSIVDFVDAATGATRTVQLVYPQDADIDAGRISILTPVGAGLIGLRTGQSIAWPDRDGHVRTLTVTKVARADDGQA